MKKSESYTSVWDAIADTPGQAANLRSRAELMQQIADFGGKETVDLLERFAPLASFDKVILESLEAIGGKAELFIPTEINGATKSDAAMRLLPPPKD